MKEEIKEIFSGLHKKFIINVVFGFGLALYSLFMFNQKEINKLNDITLYKIIENNPMLFWISFFLGFIWSNSLIKDIHLITYKKLLYRMPILLIWIILAILLSN